MIEKGPKKLLAFFILQPIADFVFLSLTRHMAVLTSKNSVPVILVTPYDWFFCGNSRIWADGVMLCLGYIIKIKICAKTVEKQVYWFYWWESVVLSKAVH